MDMHGTLDAFERTITGQINGLTKRIVRLEGINGHFAQVQSELEAKIMRLTAEVEKLKTFNV